MTIDGGSGSSTSSPVLGGGNTEAPVGTCDPDGASLYADPDDCTKYYQCSNGLEYLKSCPAGLHFNPFNLVCDWPDAACCGCASKYLVKICNI